MQRVIDIPEETFKYYVTLANIRGEQISNLERIILDSTPLPEGHGRLIDESKITKWCYMPTNQLDAGGIRTDAPTIIEGSDPE
jgi:hypothetical protein